MALRATPSSLCRAALVPWRLLGLLVLALVVLTPRAASAMALCSELMGSELLGGELMGRELMGRELLVSVAQPDERLLASSADEASFAAPDAPPSAGADDDGCTVDDDDPRSIPMCLATGASAVAPRPIHSSGDDRIEAGKRCGEGGDPAELVAPSDDAPKAPVSPALDAALAGVPSLPDAAERELPSPPPCGSTAGRRHRPALFRPPRG